MSIIEYNLRDSMEWLATEAGLRFPMSSLPQLNYVMRLLLSRLPSKVEPTEIRRERSIAAKTRFYITPSIYDKRSHLNYIVCDATQLAGKKTLAKCANRRIAELVLRQIRADYVKTGEVQNA